MPCTNCYDLCIQHGPVIDLGSIDVETETEVTLGVENIGSGYTQIVATDTDDEGNVTLDLMDVDIDDGQYYRVYVDDFDIVPPGKTTAQTCVQFQFKQRCLNYPG
jgi:hypothetical protein